MPFPKPSYKGGDFELAPADTHVARCYQVVDLGVQPNDLYGPRHQIRISWELTDCRMADGRTFMVTKYFTYSLHEKATLRHDLETWRGRPFTDEELDAWTPDALLNAPCLIQIQHKPTAKGSVRAIVASVTKVPKGLNVPPLTNQPLMYSPDYHDQHAWEQLSEKTQQQIAGRVHSIAPLASKPEPAAPAFDEDIPF
jgi:hypothetical protein